MLLITCFIFGLLGSLTWAGPHGRTACPSDTFAHKDRSEWNCYKYHDDRLTFQEAEQECQVNWRGHLASFKSQKEAKAVAAYVSNQNQEKISVWIGLQRDPESTLIYGWRWNDGSRSTYRKWKYNEPNNYTKDEYCVSLDPTHGHMNWIDMACHHKTPFLCKWKPS